MAARISVTSISGSPYAWRVLLMLGEKGLAHEVEWIERGSGRLSSPDYLALNPRAQVPVLTHGDVRLYESAAICRFLEELHPQPPLMPAAKSDRALVHQRMEEIAYLITPFEALVVEGLFTPREARDERVFARARAAFMEETARWNGFVSPEGFVVGGALTLADVLLFPLVAFAVRCGWDPSSACPRLHAWYLAMCERPAVIDSWPPHWHGTLGPDLGLNGG